MSSKNAFKEGTPQWEFMQVALSFASMFYHSENSLEEIIDFFSKNEVPRVKELLVTIKNELDKLREFIPEDLLHSYQPPNETSKLVRDLNKIISGQLK